MECSVCGNTGRLCGKPNYCPTGKDTIDELRAALKLCRDELVDFADQHQCCSISDGVLETVERALTPDKQTLE